MAQLNSELYDNFIQTRIFNREELDETFSALARLLFSSQRTAYDFDLQLRDSLRQFVEHWQNRATLQAAHELTNSLLKSPFLSQGA
jgi:hypothetical protein